MSRLRISSTIIPQACPASKPTSLTINDYLGSRPKIRSSIIPQAFPASKPTSLTVNDDDWAPWPRICSFEIPEACQVKQQPPAGLAHVTAAMFQKQVYSKSQVCSSHMFSSLNEHPFASPVTNTEFYAPKISLRRRRGVTVFFLVTVLPFACFWGC